MNNVPQYGGSVLRSHSVPSLLPYSSHVVNIDGVHSGKDARELRTLFLHSTPKTPSSNSEDLSQVGNVADFI